MIVAWHAVPGKAYPNDPSVGYGVMKRMCAERFPMGRSLSRSDCMIVVWHAVPGKAPLQKEAVP